MTSKEALLQKERELRKNLQAELETKVKQLDEENNLLKRDHTILFQILCSETAVRGEILVVCLFTSAYVLHGCMAAIKQHETDI